MSLEEIYSHQRKSNEKSLEALKRDFITIRSGKVSTQIVDNIKIDYYGNPTPLNQVGSVLVTDATTITISPWEKNLLSNIEKAIQSANIGVNPNNNGESIQLFFPPMTVEQRQKTAKDAKGMTDDAKVSIRNVRKNSNDAVKKLLKNKDISEDDSKGATGNIQKITDEMSAKADEMFKLKEVEILKV
jgi:ribosome recycling factor